MNKKDYIKSKKGLIRYIEQHGIENVNFFCAVCHLPLQIAYDFLLEDGLIEQDKYDTIKEELEDFYGKEK